MTDQAGGHRFGTHPNGPSTVAETGQLLSEFIKVSALDVCVDFGGAK